MVRHCHCSNSMKLIHFSVHLLVQPRLGPKPFSSTTGDVSFDKVFAVPLAPGSHENISTVGQDTGVDVIPPVQGAKPDLIVEIEIKSMDFSAIKSMENI